MVAAESIYLCNQAGQYEYFSIEVESNYLAHVVLLHFRWLLLRSTLGSCTTEPVSMNTYLLYRGRVQLLSLSRIVAFQVVVCPVGTLCSRAGQYEYFSLEVESNYLAHVVLLHFRWLLIPLGFCNFVHLTVSMNTSL